MEEILASIRRIISEDGTPEAKQEAKPAEPAAAPEEDVLELTEKVEDDGSVVNLAQAKEEPVEPPGPVEEPPPTDIPQPEPLFDEQRRRAAAAAAAAVIPEPEPEPVFEPPPPPPPPPPRPRPAPAQPYAGLVSPPQAEEAVNAFADLNTALEGDSLELPIGNGARTLEQLTREVMRPMLKEWLDENLPDLVERLVQEEIERMVNRAVRR
jgi:cell pole-organizing protein PopZ